MARNMSFMLTTPQVKDETKDVTRRLGWWGLKRGEVVCAIEKGQGLKKGERVKRLKMIRIVAVRVEQLKTITATEVRREGFPSMTPAEFVAFFCEHNKCVPDVYVNRIEFQYVGGV